MLGTFLILVGILASIYVGYPAAVLLLAAVGPRRLRTAAQDEPVPEVTLVIPAHDEQAIIVAKLRNFLALDYPARRLRAVVISDGSSDETCARVRGLLAELAPAEGSRITLVERPHRSGKSLALSEEVPKLDAEVLVFTDANAFYRPDAVRALMAPFADPRVGLSCGRLRYVPDAGFMSDEELYWRYEDLIKEAEGRTGRLLVANGSIYALRAALFRPIPGEVADDFALPLLVAAAGHLVVYAHDAVAEERLPAQGIENFRAKARIVTRGATALRVYWREVLRSGPIRVLQYLLHKVARWVMGLVLATLFAVSLAGATHPLLAAALTAQVTFYLLGVAAYLLARRGPVPGLLRLPFYFLLVNSAALVGLWEFLRGHRRVVWEKSETTRRSPAEEMAVAAPRAERAPKGRPFSRRTALVVALLLGAAAGLGVETGVRLTYFMRDTLRDLRGAVPPKGVLAFYEIPDPARPGNWLLRPRLELRVRDLAEQARPPALRRQGIVERARALGIGADEVVFPVNAEGYKGPPLGAPGGRPRILALGDSCSFGSLIDRLSYPRALERELARLGTPAEVVNGGVAGYYPAHVLARIEEFRGLAPDYTVLCIGSNALFGQRYAPATWTDRLYALRALHVLWQRFETRGLRHRELGEEMMERPRVPDPDDREIQRLGRYEPPFMGEVQRIGEEMRDAGSRVTILTLPSLYLSGEPPSAEDLAIGTLPRFTDNPYVLGALLSRYNQRMRELADRSGFDVVDLASWARETLRPRARYFASAVALNEEGQERMGARVAASLSAQLAKHRR